MILPHFAASLLTKALNCSGVVDRASFRHLGPRVEQILSLAEEQADDILASANEEIEARRAAAEHIIAEARQQAAKALKDFELALTARRAEEDEAADLRGIACDGIAAVILAHAQKDAELGAFLDGIGGGLDPEVVRGARRGGARGEREKDEASEHGMHGV